MANHKSAEKRIRSSAKRQERNHYQAKTTRNALKKLRGSDDPKELTEKLSEVISMLDKLVKHNIIHKNKASNLKSKLMKKKMTMEKAKV